MHWLYRLQQRLALTRHEGLALLTLFLLFLTGIAARHIQQQSVPPITVDSLVTDPPADTAALRPDSNVSRAPSPEHPVNVNTASKSALEVLPGIGPALSERIVTYRSSQRPFQQVDELRRVRGIGPKTLADLRPLVRVAPPDTSE